MVPVVTSKHSSCYVTLPSNIACRDVFERAYGDRCFRVRNAGDIVPFLLPQWLGYRLVLTIFPRPDLDLAFM